MDFTYDRWLSSDLTEIAHVMHTKFLTTILVLGIESNEGHIMSPHFFQKGRWINAPVYIKVLKEVVKPWIDSVRENRLYIF